MALLRRGVVGLTVFVGAFFFFLFYLNGVSVHHRQTGTDGGVSSSPPWLVSQHAEDGRVLDSNKSEPNEQQRLDEVVIANEHEQLDRELQVVENERLDLLYTAKIRQLDKPKVIILSACDSSCDPDIVNKSLMNRETYAAQFDNVIHQYVDLEKYKHDKSSAWFKIPAIQDMFKRAPEADWIWWLDIDAVIMNKSINICRDILSRQVIETCLAWDHPLRDTDTKFRGHKYFSKATPPKLHELDLIISQDQLGLNAGSFFIRRSAFADILLDLWSAVDEQEHWNRHEQDGLIHLLLTYKSLLRHVALVPQRLFNSYHDESFSHPWRYKPGDFVVHFAGKSLTRGFKDLYNSYFNA
ncbi:hypothetical protein TRICI_006567 [Trichomonascus ciferrii]|uniref:Uncharacterized protein n=1 Tax=Trichomonascus ciferrii TaxID=44093 RepID=A0A642UG54_9ASCO|nr:hypothetical protein TRICI_006567 [Trichomonascus ciferrii]